MGAVRPYTSVNTSSLAAQMVTIQAACEVFRSYHKRRIPEMRRVIRARFVSPETQPALPFIWSSDPAAQKRARAYYFALIVPRGSAGGRYERTGALAQGWEVAYLDNPNGADVLMENAKNGAEYVYGQRKNPSHYLNGHADADAVSEELGVFFGAQMADDWGYVSTGRLR